jgi:hypothetical protein
VFSQKIAGIPDMPPQDIESEVVAPSV